MYCKKCGEKVDEYSNQCPNCGAVVTQSYAASSNNDSGSAGYCVLGFCVPIAGLVLWLVWKDEKPNNASSAGTGALIAFILGFLSYFFAILGALV